jgi:cyclic beta-1,2-glucan synthetase
VIDTVVTLPQALERQLEVLMDRPDASPEGALWDGDRLWHHGRMLAAHSNSTLAARRVNLKRSLRADSRALRAAYGLIVTALEGGRAVSPAAQWIVDNFHVISDQLVDAPLRLTPAIWRQLPAAAHPDAAGWPRIHHIATEYLRHTLWEFKPESLVRMLDGYQEVALLTMRELWALYPILQIALIAELRRVAMRVEDSLAARVAADELADALVHGPAAVDAVRPRPSRWTENRFAAPFIVQYTHRLQGMGERGRPFLDALSRQLARRGSSIDDCIQRQHARRSASNVAARNIITSLRALGSFDWRMLFEKTSRVEALLQEQQEYLASDRRTRDRYRGSIEQIARTSRRDELSITQQILGLPGAAPEPGQLDASLGSWLIGQRRGQLESRLQIRAPLSCRIRRVLVSHAQGLYLGGLAACTLGITAVAVVFGTEWRASSPAFLTVLALLAMVPASELAMGVLHRYWLRAFPPRHLPSLGLESGLGPDMKTLVVVPTLLRNAADAVAACRQLQVHALANPDPCISFALLSDWTDSDTETRPDDAEILAVARREIAALNDDVPGAAGEPKFFLLHRRRQWHDSEGCYTGWERKRGKLAELNRLLLGAGPTSFLPEAGQLRVPSDIRYVLTVDADTRLPLGCVRDLVGTAAHPLNRPVICPEQRRVVQGYGVLQPRITPLLPETGEQSLYREIVTSGSGIDPYAAAVSDLHQDVFGEGLFTGKGLYDLRAWEEVLRNRVPPASMLSHDLFEGIFARCGLVSDIELFEDFPSHSEVAAGRAHRWMRGDWQLLPWILGRHGPLPPLGRWKMLDNLRRSLQAPFSIALLIAAFSDPTSRPLIWLLVVLAPFAWPALATAFERLTRTPLSRSRRVHMARLVADLGADLGRAAVSLAMLAQNAWLAIDAIARALYRVAISRRHLLEWTTASHLKAGQSEALASFVWPLKSASIVVVSAVGVLMVANPPATTRFAPLLLLWWLSPVLARFLSRPLDAPRTGDSLPQEVAQELRGTARLTWTFFETHVTTAHHCLPPDNFQEDPLPVVAHRSSPTNMGLYLLAAFAARDFGWLGLLDTSERLDATLATLRRLERFEGHLLNWYDTRTLQPLAPLYVSTVDSGNLAGHLLTLRQACVEAGPAPLLSPRAMRGPRDALALCRQELLAEGVTDAANRTRRTALLHALRQIDQGLEGEPATLGLAKQQLQAAAQSIAALRGDTLTPAVTRWIELAGRDVDSHLRDLRLVLPDGITASASAIADLPGSATLFELARLSAPCAALSRQLHDLAGHCQSMVADMSFSFLFDRGRGLFSIGYRVADRTLDDGYYDLLASEARLASLVAIAKGDVPRSHWFRLGRRLTGGSRHPVLASWSGSMFEYLMPTLVMQEPPHSLLEQTNRRVVELQIRHGEQHQLPWGISESAYNVRDREYTYQYSAFGVPALGLKRGLAANYVVAPYATLLAAMYSPVEANDNLRALARASGRGKYGYYEALDYTPSRVPEGSAVAVVRAYMAHHQGMGLVALDNVLQDGQMQARFHAEPSIAAAQLLLQERSLRFVDAPQLAVAEVPAAVVLDDAPDVARTIDGCEAPTPVTHLLSNRHYTVMLSDAGGGYSSWRGRAVTRWREDATRDCWGSFIYLRDVDQGVVWSAGFQPARAAPDEYRVQFNEECAVYSRRDGSLRTLMAVVVAPDDDGELRQVTLHNEGSRARHIELTSYAEIVLAPQRADVAHPGFSNLFVQTEFAAESGALLATRRPRSDREQPVWAIHVIAGVGQAPAQLQYETDRGRFLGRGRDHRMPHAMEGGTPLSNTVGNVLDPIFSLRTQVTVPPRSKVSVTFATFVAGSREQAAALIAKYRTPALFQHVVGSAWTFARAEIYYLRITLGEAQLFQSLAGHLLFSTKQLRAARESGAPNTLDVTHLWRFSISGDRPILLIRSHSLDDLPFITQCLRAQEYLRIKNLVVDVVILNERRHSYVQDLQQAIEHAARDFASQVPAGGESGGIYPLAMETMGEGERRLLLALARVVLDPAQGGLKEQLSRPTVARPTEARPQLPAASQQLPPARGAPDLAYFNGWGGFAEDGREYVISLGGRASTPAPWSNVLANEHFGTLVTERGSMCTWSMNSRENQLTPWSNDAVGDPSGERFYLLADDGELWSPAAQPVRRADARYEIRHGQGYSHFDVTFQDIASRLTVFVAATDPVKLCRLRLVNHSATARRVTVFSCVDWALGAMRAGINHDVQTHLDRETGALFAANPALVDFGSRVAFCDLGGRQQYCTDSRREFLGRNGSLDWPAGLSTLSQWTVASAPGRDPCCAFAVTVELPPQGTEEVLFMLGQAEDAAQARQLVQKYRASGAQPALDAVKTHWDRLLGTVVIRTPDRALDLLFNRWLLYQTISCRLWGRTGFYQSGGAFGFRDQLQDGMALTLCAPQQVRAHLLRAAARQFVEGDVQHWWHPPSGRGVRTHFSDDRVWLPLAVEQYMDSTGDITVLDEVMPFIEGPPLPLDREDAHYVPQVSRERANLYEHCARALDRSLANGVHGLPLIGGGDWNDGMNRVGHEGRGESVWLAWFLIFTLRRFLPVARARNDEVRVARWSGHIAGLAEACEREAWDGQWYCRAFFDDGTPLGSSRNTECRIDSLSQSWAVLSGAANPARALAAMESVERQLVRQDEGLVLLFAPPFDSAPVDPGYIKGYLPGLRENGGQYTHAAIWVLMAQAMLGRNQQVGELLQMLNPVRRAATQDGARTYRVEPYVLAADIYSGSGITQRGGWTWYTGASGWMYRAVLEQVLGIRISGDTLRVVPCVPPDWQEFEVQQADYVVRMKRGPVSVPTLVVDGAPLAGDTVMIQRDQRPHLLELILPDARL